MNPDGWILMRQDCEDGEEGIACAFEIRHKEAAVIYGTAQEEAFGAGPGQMGNSWMDGVSDGTVLKRKECHVGI